ncbi:MAG: hypothetical protein ACRD0M_12820 [Acidimicrobiales bacterium]
MRSFLWATAVRRGLFGGSRPWMVVLAVIGTARLLRRLAGSAPETVLREKLAPGEQLIVTHLARRR